MFDPWIGKIPWRRKWQPTPVLLPGKFQGQRSLIGYSPWDCKESDMTEQLHFQEQDPDAGTWSGGGSGTDEVSFPVQAQKEAESLGPLAESFSGHLLYAEHRARWEEQEMGRERYTWAQKGDKAQAHLESLEEAEIWDRGGAVGLRP